MAPSPLVDVTSGQAALSKAYQAQETGAATLAELDRQAQVLDSMQGGLDRINNHVDVANRELRAIESVGGALANKLTAEPTARPSRLLGSRASVGPNSGQLSVAPKPVTIAVVWKHKNDSLEPAQVRLTVDSCEAESMLEERRHLDRWLYDNVDSVTVRSRCLHVDITFRDGRERVRVATAHIQRLVNELALRCASGGRAMPVIFEKDSIHFPYNQEWLRGAGEAALPGSLSPAVARRGAAKGGLGAAPLTTRSADEDLLSANADESVRIAFRMQDQQVDAISDAVRQLGVMGERIGVEVDRQNEQIVYLNTALEDTNARVSKVNQRVVRATNNV